MRGRRTLWVAMVVAAGLVAGCGADGASSPTPVVGSGTSVASPTTSAATGATSTTAPTDGPTLRGLRVALTTVATLEQPVAVLRRPGDATGVYLVERVGRVRVLRGPSGAPGTVLDMTTRTRAGGERGLLGAAFSLDGASLFVHYTDPGGTSRVDAYTMSAGGLAEPSSRRELLSLAQPYPNHNGGDLAVGADGMLYVAFGDGGSGGDPQRYSDKLNTWLGKILRIDPRPADGGAPYRVPADNPFVGRAGAKPEIWSYGLRNPWRISFDPATGDLWIGDVGQGELEEVNRARAADGAGRGVNFGWSAFEGSARFNDDVDGAGAVGPVHEYRHSDGGCSVTGGHVYRGSRIGALVGAYVFADYCVAGLRAIDPASPQASVAIASTGKAIVGMGPGPDGALYVVSLDGPVYRVDPA
jgi:glucose/arabinose dehydrogenase